MLNVQTGERVMPKDAVYGGEVMAVNHVRRSVTFRAGNSEMANWHTLFYDQLVKLILVNNQVQQIPVRDEEFEVFLQSVDPSDREQVLSIARHYDASRNNCGLDDPQKMLLSDLDGKYPGVRRLL